VFRSFLTPLRQGARDTPVTRGLWILERDEDSIDRSFAVLVRVICRCLPAQAPPGHHRRQISHPNSIRHGGVALFGDEDVAVVEQQEPVAAGVRFAMRRGRRLVRRARACGAVGWDRVRRRDAGPVLPVAARSWRRGRTFDIPWHRNARCATSHETAAIRSDRWWPPFTAAQRRVRRSGTRQAPAPAASPCGLLQHRRRRGCQRVAEDRGEVVGVGRGREG